jgi:DNA-binding CsgD family transcriptional regulator
MSVVVVMGRSLPPALAREHPNNVGICSTRARRDGTLRPMRDHGRVERDIASVARRETDSHALRVAVMERLHRAVPVDGYCFAAADPTTLVATATAVDGVDRTQAPALYEIEHGVAPEPSRHRDLVRQRLPVAVLSHATDGELDRAARWREVLGPMGVRHELRAAARAGDTTWGFIHLFRSDRLPDFDADEVALVARVARLVAPALRDRALPTHVAVAPPVEAPAVLMLDEHGALVERTPAGDAHVAALRDPAQPDAPVPEVLVTLAVWARVLAACGRPESARAQVPGADGRWRLLHAAATDRGRVAITCQVAPPEALRPLILSSYGLSPGERAIVELALAGRSTKQMAAELVISPHTVQDRLKGVFEKVGVRSRRDLVARLSGR